MAISNPFVTISTSNCLYTRICKIKGCALFNCQDSNHIGVMAHAEKDTHLHPQQRPAFLQRGSFQFCNGPLLMVKTSGWVCNTRNTNCGKKWPRKNMCGCFTTINNLWKTHNDSVNPWTHSGLPFGLTHLDDSPFVLKNKTTTDGRRLMFHAAYFLLSKKSVCFHQERMMQHPMNENGSSKISLFWACLVMLLFPITLAGEGLERFPYPKNENLQVVTGILAKGAPEGRMFLLDLEYCSKGHQPKLHALL